MKDPEGADVPLGARLLDGRDCSFTVWAPLARRIEVHLLQPEERIVELQAGERGYHAGCIDGVSPGARYLLRLDGELERPDPASRSQPEGVHGPSAVVPVDFPWTDHDWRGLPLAGSVFYEAHVGTFTGEGTFDAIVPRLPALASLGITTIELMPVAHFPGTRNWGYDGVYPFAVHEAYGGPERLKAFIDACHANGLAVALDVVYNHLGPEGNYLVDFGPYFTDRYHTPWGSALNFDGAGSDEVRRFFIENALQWIDEFHVDVLRLDAVHAIIDASARPFLQELADSVHARAESLGREVHLVAESDLGDPRMVRPARLGGHGMDAQWSDDFHHALHAVLTGEGQGYYMDFGEPAHLADVFRAGYVYTGQYSRFRERRHGAPPSGIAPERFIVYAQNHDQVGNRLAGDRLTAHLSFEELKLAAATVLLSPFTPLLFMGEEYGETAPFPYFVSHSDPELVEAVRQGRKDEFASFGWSEEPPDPQSERTFRSAVLDWQMRERPRHGVLQRVHAALLALRRNCPELISFQAIDTELVHDRGLVVRRRNGSMHALAAFNYSAGGATIPLSDDAWRVRFDSASSEWDGPGPVRATVKGSIALHAHSAVLLTGRGG
jgi:maltooligosyltrehalose trehalohydrolase